MKKEEHNLILKELLEQVDLNDLRHEHPEYFEKEGNQ